MTIAHRTSGVVRDGTVDNMTIDRDDHRRTPDASAVTSTNAPRPTWPGTRSATSSSIDLSTGGGRSSSRYLTGPRPRGPEDEHGDVVALVLAGAGETGERHRAEVATADGDVDRIAANAG